MKLPQVIFVTGKGGTGKSTIVAALALGAARRGPVTVIDLDRRRCAIKALNALPVADTPGRGGIDFLALGERGELEAFIERIVPLKAIARRMLQSRTFGFVSTALPGLEAFLILERIRLCARAAAPDRSIIVDAPATGSALELLNVPAGVQRLAPIGTLHRLAAEVDQFVRAADHFGVLLVARAEELALGEAAEARGTLDALGVSCIGSVLNQCETELFTEAEIAGLSGLAGHQRLARARRHAAASAVRAKRRLRDAKLNPVDLPLLHSAVLGLAELETLARRLDEGLAAR